MRFKQQVLLKHDNGITAQWISEDWSCMAIATYYQQEKEGLPWYKNPSMKAVARF